MTVDELIGVLQTADPSKIVFLSHAQALTIDYAETEHNLYLHFTTKTI